jgi:hypothetical protein
MSSASERSIRRLSLHYAVKRYFHFITTASARMKTVDIGVLRCIRRQPCTQCKCLDHGRIGVALHGVSARAIDITGYEYFVGFRDSLSLLRHATQCCSQDLADAVRFFTGMIRTVLSVFASRIHGIFSGYENIRTNIG